MVVKSLLVTIISNKFYYNTGICNHLSKNGSKITTCNRKLVLIL